MQLQSSVENLNSFLSFFLASVTKCFEFEEIV